MLSKRYTFSELNKVLMESHNEFNPRIGDKVESEDKKNNEKAVDDIMKQSKEFDGGITDKKKNTNKEDVQDFNKTTLDVNFASEPGDAYKERVKAQVHGFPSAENEKNSKIEEENDSLDFEGNKDFYDTQKKKSEKVNARQTDIKHAGLKARELPKEYFENDTLFKENKAMKRLHFKNTVFLSEAQMLKKVPEEFKTADGRFIMKDASGTEYLVECSYNSAFKHSKLTVINKTNKEQINEQLGRMRQLFDYSSSSYMGGTTSVSRKNEAKCLSEMINRVKNINESLDGLFDVYTNDHMRNSPVFVSYNGQLYQVPDEMKEMLKSLGTKDGRNNFINAISNLQPSNVDILKLKGYGYNSRSFNANAF